MFGLPELWTRLSWRAGEVFRRRLPAGVIAPVGPRLIALFVAGAGSLVLAHIVSAALDMPDLEDWVFLTLLAFSAWRARRMAVVVGASSITVRNFWRTYEVKWSDISAIRYADFWPSPVNFTLATIIAIDCRSRRLPVVAQALVGRSAGQIEALEAAARSHPDISVESWD